MFERIFAGGVVAFWAQDILQQKHGGMHATREKLKIHMHSLYVCSRARRKIRLMESNAKCCHLKKLIQRDCAAGVYLSEAQNPIPPPPYTLCKWIQLIHTGN
jgi:hypothetical protein